MKDDFQDSETGNGLPLRQVLHTMLDEGEQRVPSTATNIMAAIRLEQQTTQKLVKDGVHDTHTSPPLVPFPPFREIETPRPKRARQTLYNALALSAIAAILIASFGLLSFIIPQHSASTSTGSVSNGATSNNPVNIMTRNPALIPSTTTSWPTLMITYKMNGMTLVANYDPVTAASRIVASLPYADTIVHSISHNGRELLYSVFDGLKTSFYIYPQTTLHPVFMTPDKSRSAIWSTDDRTLFISTAKGIMSVDVQTLTANLLFPTLPSVVLTNYRNDGYLYFIKGTSGQTYATEGTFNRINIDKGYTQKITPCDRGSNFWLSPGGSTVYYNCLDQNVTTLYAVNSDGTNPHTFRSNAGTIIGYVEDGSPLTFVNVDGKHQVVQRDTKSTHDTVLIQDVAPGATSINADDIAVAPYGYTLVAKGMYSNKGQVTHEEFWYSNLTTGISQSFYIPQGASLPHLIGWDKLQVSGLLPSLTP